MLQNRVEQQQAIRERLKLPRGARHIITQDCDSGRVAAVWTYEYRGGPRLVHGAVYGPMRAAPGQYKMHLLWEDTKPWWRTRGSFLNYMVRMGEKHDLDK